MKKLVTYLTLNIFICSFGFSQDWKLPDFSKSCMGEYPIYYAKSKVYIYQDMSENSAIQGEVPAGRSVKVTQSSSGDMGWWEICFEGKTGFAKKSLLSYKEINTNNSTPKQQNSKNYNISNEDVGFDPFIGQTTSNVSFRTGPSQSYSKISTLSTETPVYIYSNRTVNDYYKAIDIVTSDIGWVHKDYVSYLKDAEINESGAFQSTGYSSSFESEVKIKNNSSYNIKLIVGDETFELTPNSIKTVNIKPGRKYYIATAPGVIPASGYQGFESNNGYDWEFWVSTTAY